MEFIMGNTSRRRAQPNSSAVDMLRSFAERIVRLREEIKVFQADIKDIRNEAGAQGYDKKALMLVVARMMEDNSDRVTREETAALADVYLASLGMLDGTPLGDAARRRFDPIDDPLDSAEESEENADRSDGNSDVTSDEEPSPIRSDERGNDRGGARGRLHSGRSRRARVCESLCRWRSAPCCLGRGLVRPQGLRRDGDPGRVSQEEEAGG
ncbi:DUF2312 domain-containing protein [Methylorubrum suomiense]